MVRVLGALCQAKPLADQFSLAQLATKSSFEAPRPVRIALLGITLLPRSRMSQATRNTQVDSLADAARQILPAPSTAKAQVAATPEPGLGLWMPPLFLGSVLFAAYVLLQKPDGLWPWVVGTMFAIVFSWFFVSALWPRSSERTCPSCDKNGLTRLNEDSHKGLRCTLCGFKDENLSSFFIAEEEGALEETVMRERGRAPIAPRLSGEKL